MSATEVAALVKQEEASIEVELDEEPEAVTTTDRNGVRAASATIVDIAKRGSEEARDPELKRRLAVLAVVLGARIGAIDVAVQRAGRGLHSNQRYSPETLDASRSTKLVVARAKRRLHKRLGKLEVDDEIRKAAGVGDAVDQDAAIVVRDAAVGLRRVFATADYTPRFTARRINVGLFDRQLAAALPLLEAALARGLAGEVRASEAGTGLHRALRGFEVALERTVGELEDAGLDALAAQLESAVPAKRAGAKTPEAPVPAPATT